MSDSSVTVVHNAEKQRYEVRDDDAVVGYTQYPPDDGRLVFDHTEIDKGYSGQGLGGKLVGFALDDVRERGKRIVAICSYVDKFIEKHPDYRDLTD
ncbi:GNAT family N-acetyltransferase [Rhodococcus sp. p52]|uniref:GNAT family N-acetyltransferase n=1 Tax=Rhodococcus sp. p52 TaxID=935199 RepID=UPI000826611F|nr:GNAT family N-acetyltransferase [Rhodococcus sp. p52]AOD21162.1 GNAT family N-acetyltransferase [Rhodococcus sp. p52]